MYPHALYACHRKELLCDQVSCGADDVFYLFLVGAIKFQLVKYRILLVIKGNNSLSTWGLN